MIERIYCCDRDGCDTHARTMGMDPPVTFFEIFEGGSDVVLHFCGWDCILKHAAETPPAERVEPLGGGEA